MKIINYLIINPNCEDIKEIYSNIKFDFSNASYILKSEYIYDKLKGIDEPNKYILSPNDIETKNDDDNKDNNDIEIIENDNKLKRKKTNDKTKLIQNNYDTISFITNDDNKVSKKRYISKEMMKDYMDARKDNDTLTISLIEEITKYKGFEIINKINNIK